MTIKNKFWLSIIILFFILSSAVYQIFKQPSGNIEGKDLPERLTVTPTPSP